MISVILCIPKAECEKQKIQMTGNNKKIIALSSMRRENGERAGEIVYVIKIKKLALEFI